MPPVTCRTAVNEFALQSILHIDDHRQQMAYFQSLLGADAPNDREAAA